MNWVRLIFLQLLSVAILAGCTIEPDTFLRAPEEVEKATKEALRATIAKDGAQLEAIVTADIPPEELTAGLDEYLSHIPNGEFIEEGLAGRSIRAHVQGYTEYVSTYQLTFEGGWTIVEVHVETRGEKVDIVGLYSQRIYEDLREVHAFSLPKKPIQNYFLLALCITSFLFVLCTVITIIRRWRVLRRPIVWLFVSLIGLTAWTIEWTTGIIWYELLHIGFLGAGYEPSSGYSSAYFTLYLPIGAALFWWLAKKKPPTSPH